MKSTNNKHANIQLSEIILKKVKLTKQSLYGAILWPVTPEMSVRVPAAGGFLLSIPFGRQRLMDNEITREHSAAVILQKYFRMWLAQARLIRLQLDAIGKPSSDADRIVFPEQSSPVFRLFAICCKNRNIQQARSYIGTRGGQLPPRWMLCPPPQTSHLQFFLHINFPSPVSLDAQM